MSKPQASDQALGAKTDELPVAVRTNVTELCKKRKKLSKKTSTKKIRTKKTKKKSKASSFITICRRYLMNTYKPLEKVRLTAWLHNKHNSNLFIIADSLDLCCVRNLYSISLIIK